MVDPNKFANNFLSLLDDFQAKKPVNPSRGENKDGKQKDENIAKDNEDTLHSKGVRKKEREEQTNARDGGRISHDRRSIGNQSTGRGGFDHRERKQSTKRTNVEEERPELNIKRNEEKLSDQFFSLIDTFDNKLSLNKSEVLEKGKHGDSSSTHSVRDKKIDSSASGNKRNHTREKTNERQSGFVESRKDNNEPVRAGSSKNSNTWRDRRGNENCERGNLRREPETSTKKINKMMGYKFLESLLDSEMSFVVTTLASPRSGFQELVDSRPIRPDLLMLIVKVLDKIIESEAHQLKVQILSNTFKPEFIDEIKKFVACVCVEDNRKRLLAMNTFFVNVLNVLDTVVNSLPSTMNEKLKSTLNALNLSMKSVRDEHNINVSNQLFEQLKELTDQVSSYIEHKNKIEKEQSHVNKKDNPPPNSYRDIALIPTKEDFTLVDGGYLRQNIVKGSYRDVDHYLDVQFRLLREDFIAPLRDGIYEYIDSISSPSLKRRYSNVRIYPKVKFENPFTLRDMYGFYIQFDCAKRLTRNINWEYNKRFMPGSLLLFTDDNFQTFYLATVGDRKIEQLNKGLLFVTFVPGTEVPEYLFDAGKFFVMAESEVYYEAYKHVLSALQRMSEKNFPMQQYIVDVDTTCFPPAYLMDNYVYKISTYSVNLLNDKSWPTPEQLKLNPSQHQALKSALTNDFSVIQGPPGTGKTFLALKITEILLKNEVSHNTPIVVICFTNHALDQFLEGILKYTDNLVRIGFQSQNEALKKYNLDEVRKKIKGSRNHNFSALFKEALGEKFEVQTNLQNIKEKIDELCNPTGILNLNVLRSVITPPQFNELIKEPNQVINWLFGYDDPEFHMMEKQMEKAVETPSEVAQAVPVDAFGASKGLPESAADLQEEEYEELDEEETARRLADMTEDDFFEDVFFQERDYTRKLTYSLEFKQIEQEIEDIKYEMKTRVFNNENFAFYFKTQCIEEIRALEWQQRFMNEQMNLFMGFKFSPERFSMFQDVYSVWEMSVNDRWEYYATWVHLYTCQLKQVAQHLTKIYQDVLMKLHELRQLEDLRFVQAASVVGLTTSGAAKRRVLLENLGTRIVIVEEAAEVLEAHIVTSLSPSVQHVILIGDHKQLKPNPAVFKLAKKYNMDCSLFERMINNGLGCSVLNEQHRMRPEISSLITPVIYPSLYNHPSTLDREKIRGVDRMVFFLSHDHPEDQMPDSSSKQNTFEADLLMELCKYFLLNDYKPEEITILATYAGQVWYMRKRKREMGSSCPGMRAVRITPVDNFQGEENRIILLSLVRSNKENKIGFLSTENRVCVALSRAKEGLYIVGNMDNLTNSSTIWPRIKQQLEAINAFGRKLTLRCERHPDQLTQVSQVKDFKRVPEGGCTLKCKAELNCGHICPKVCHIIDKDHGFFKCKEKCKRPPCPEEGHKCPLRCWETCMPCVILVDKQLPCGHTATLRCHEEPAAHKCLQKVPAVHPACKHEILKPCYQDVNNCSCTNPCSSRLPCGHSCEDKCHINKDPDHLEYKCFKDCVKEYEGCPRKAHPCPKRCYQVCEACQVPMQTTLPCGHRHNIPCSADPETFKCTRDCERIMPCDHKCKAPCWVKCDPTQCTQLVDKEAKCGHIMRRMKCNEPTDKRTCKETCKRTLPCGHPCKDKCFNDCTKVLCQEVVDSWIAPLCGHPVIKIPCHLNNKEQLRAGSDELVQLCEQPCGMWLKCGHQCKGKCGACLQGRLHVPCVEKCNKTLMCGHECTSKCCVLCPPCSVKKCLTRCPHGPCHVPKTRNHTCFTLCEPCNKNCPWSCHHYKCNKRCGQDCDRPPCNEPCPEMLACGHDCMGYCGEICPPFCGVCNSNPEINVEPGDRYVVLSDCRHMVESREMDNLVANATRNNIYRQMICPYPDCSEPIVNTLRYRNVYFGFRRQVAKIEQTVKSEEITRLQKLHNRHAKLLGSDPTISPSLNMLMKNCSKPFYGTSLNQKEMGRLIVGCLLQPLAVRCDEIKRKKPMHAQGGTKPEEEQRLKFRLEYLASALIARVDQISYETILQLELAIGHVIRLTQKQDLENFLGQDWVQRNAELSWYQVTPYSWVLDRHFNMLKPVPRLSATLRTRDSAKQWYVCDNQHLFVSETGETCVTCKLEAEENQQRLEEEAKQKENQEQESVNINQRSNNKYQAPVITDYRRGTGRGRGRGRGRGNQGGGNRGRKR